MSWGAVAGAAVTVIGSSMNKGAASSASGAQQGMSAAQIAQNNAQYAAYKKAISPYTSAGTSALAQQRALLGLGSGTGGIGQPGGIDVESYIRKSAGEGFDNGYRSGNADRNGIIEGALSNYRSGAYGSDEDALKAFGFDMSSLPKNALTPEQEQAAAVSSIANSPYFQSLTKQSEDALLQNASATGGLRGGNTQDALSKNRPILLQGLIDKQLANLGNLSAQGLNAETNLGSAGQGLAASNGAAYQQMGAAQAGGILAQNNADVSAIGQIGGLVAKKLL